MSSLVQQVSTEKSPQKNKVDDKAPKDQSTKKTIKKPIVTPPVNANKQPVITPKLVQSSPYKNIPIAAKPPSNQISIAPILPKQPLAVKPIVSPTNKQQKQVKVANQQQQQQQQQQPHIAPQQINQQPRILFNGNLQTLLASVNNPNNQNLTQQHQQFAQQLATASAVKQQTNQMLPNNQFYPGMLPKAPIVPKSQNNSNSLMSDAPTVFTATTTPDGQIIFSTMNGNQQQMNNNLQQQLIQHNIINMIQQQNANKAMMPQQPFMFGQNQLNNLMQHQGLLQQQNQQHAFMPNNNITQPVATSTPTPAESTPENMLRQKLYQEEQKFQQLQQQLKNKQEVTKQQPMLAIKPKQELNQTMPSESKTLDDMALGNRSGSSDTLLNTSDPGNKGRGRPRLYVKNPVTGKSIKGKRLDGTTVFKSSKPPKIIVPGAKKLLIKSLNKKKALENGTVITTTTNGVFPSPSTSVSSAHSIPSQLNGPAAKRSETDSTSEEMTGTGSSSELDTDSITSEERQITYNKPVVVEKHKVLNHVIEGFLVKESPAPFTPNLNSTMNIFSCELCKSSQRQETATEKFCSLICSKRHAKKLLKKSRKSLDSSHNRKENKESHSCNSHSLSPSKPTLLEDTTNNLSTCMKSKCKSHHKHHKHRRHHGSSSSSSSRDKKKFKMSNIEQSEEQPGCSLPPPQLQTFKTSPQAKLTFQPAPQQQYNNTFSSSLLNQSYSTSADQQLPQGDPVEWDCDQVFEFVKCVAGVNVAQVFRSQEVDGSALSLIRDDHLVNTMQIKLGPALKIMSKFNELKTKSMNGAY
jgi:hypothetical protein